MANETMQVAIYNIETSLFPDLDNEEIIKKIVDDYNNNLNFSLKTKPFLEQPLRNDIDFHGFNVQIFYSEKGRSPKWTGFLEPILDNNAELLKGTNRYVSFVSFIYDDVEIFAVTGGQGNFLIQNYINTNFGTDIITRLISENSKVIKAINERGLTGSLMASKKFYRHDYRLLDEDNFGKLYQQVKAELDISILSTKLGLPTEDLKNNVGCVAKSSFQLNKSISIDSLFNLISSLSTLLHHPPNFNLNNAKLLLRRDMTQKKLIQKLDDELAQLLLEDYKKSNINLQLDICHPEYEKFLTATSYNLFMGRSKKPVFKKPLDEIKDFRFFHDAINKIRPTIDTVEEMGKLLKNLQLASFNYDNEVLTKAPLFKHLHGEIKYNNTIFFRIDGEWYQIENQFIEKLEQEFNEIVLQIIEHNLLSEPWEADEDEDCYNLKYIGKDSFLVLHKVLLSGMELCDLLKYDEKTAYLIHVKKGFGNSMRDLTLQIDIAARTLKEARVSRDYDFFGQLYQRLKMKKATTYYGTKVARQAALISKEEFIKILIDNDIVFCLAFLDTAQKERSIINGYDFQSSIAKYSIIELYRRLRIQETRLKLIQVSRK